MTEPKFSVVVVGRNEASTLPRLLGSLSEFFARGGNMVYVDTGSTDGTQEVARKAGCVVYEEGDRFRYTCDEETAKEINRKFAGCLSESPLINAGDSFFAFDQARNYAMTLAKNDFICTPDCDEAWTVLDIDKLNALIEDGYEKFYVNFVFAHFPDGKPSVQFMADTRFYDRRRIKWKGIIHETMQHDGPLKTANLTKDIAFLEHFQNKETNRDKYLAGLAWACHQEPDNDRNSHYFARELMYKGKYYSAIEEFLRHIKMNRWDLERGQSMIYLGTCYDAVGDSENALKWWMNAVNSGGARREPFINMAYYWKRKDKPVLVGAYAAAALQIPNNGFYANRVANYTFEPHALMYWAKGWQADIPAARQHLMKCLEYHPTDEKFLADMQYYFTKEEQDEAKRKAGYFSGKNRKFQDGRVINRIALPITRACNRNCPECSARKADPDWDKDNPHVSIEELKRVGKLLGPIQKIEVTGGEPSIHPDFKEISEGLHQWFDCKDIMLLTNGYLFRDERALPLLLNYDRVYVTHYTPEFADRYGTPTNTDVHDKIRDYLKDHPEVKFWSQRMDKHTPICEPPYRGIPTCGYDKGDSVGYGEGKIYGCCTAYWLPDKGVGIPLTEDWRDHLSEIELPCGKCFLTGK